MKHGTFTTVTSATILVLASACSGVDETSLEETNFETEEPKLGFGESDEGEDESNLELEGPMLGSSHDETGDDEASLEAKEASAARDEPSTGTLEQALGAPKVRAHDNRPFYGNIFAQTFPPYVIGEDCSPGYVRSTPKTRWTQEGAGSCGFAGWLTNISSDCRALIWASTPGGWVGGTCESWVYEERPPIAFLFNAANTNSAQMNTVNRALDLAAGDTVTIGTCGLPGSTFTGDTFLRLHEPSGLLVALNDDACEGFGSRFTHTAATTGTFSLRVGCYSGSACTGTVVIQ